ncbi:unnamed protein product [Mytilus coruscus]|uniref:Uncharacterized protein n=1 Tax=Mytilus coruscus TaxID=42192 RepID=A0A6J8D679_MYTCO|nr:unnamed protein product [Mytilus coruscus]
MWKTENVDWDKFKVNIDNVFDEHWHEASNDINVLWDIWKAKVNYAADMVMKKVPFVNNYRNFWDKPLDRMLKSRRDANRLQRLHNRTRNHDSQLGTHISGVYKKRKLALHEAIKRKEFDRKVRCLTVKGIATNKNSKFFWKLLRGPKESVNPSRIIDPNNKDDFIEDDADINIYNFNGFETSIPVKPTSFKPNEVSKVTNGGKEEKIVFLLVRMETKLNSQPSITGLSDMNRPTKLAEKFNSAYDNQWTHTFERSEDFTSMK